MHVDVFKHHFIDLSWQPVQPGDICSAEVDQIPVRADNRILAKTVRQVHYPDRGPIVGVGMLGMQVIGRNLTIGLGKMPQLHNFRAEFCVVEAERFALQFDHGTLLCTICLKYL